MLSFEMFHCAFLSQPKMFGYGVFFFFPGLLGATSCGAFLLMNVSWDATVFILHVWWDTGPDSVSHDALQISWWGCDSPKSGRGKNRAWICLHFLQYLVRMVGEMHLNVWSVSCIFQASPFLVIYGSCMFHWKIFSVLLHSPYRVMGLFAWQK